MRNAGVIISSAKGTFYEWQRTVHCGNSKFGDVYVAQQPDGIYLSQRLDIPGMGQHVAVDG